MYNNNNKQRGGKKPYNNQNGGNNKTLKKAKPKFVKIKIHIANSDFYNNCLDNLYNLLEKISFDLVSVPCYMAKSAMYGDKNAKGVALFGIVEKFNSDNTFTVSVDEKFADKFDEKSHVMHLRCRKDYNTGEINYIYQFTIADGESVESQYGDIEAMMTIGTEE